jgi:hypothetical protein
MVLLFTACLFYVQTFFASKSPEQIVVDVDVVDNIGLFAGMARTRNKWYRYVNVIDVKDHTIDQAYSYGDCA